MYEKKAFLVPLSLILLVAVKFCISQAHTEKKLGHISESKGKGPCENGWVQKYCLNGGDCFYLADEGKIGCICTSLYGGKRCKNKNMWWEVG